MTTAIKDYREQAKLAKQLIKGIDVLVQGGEEFKDLEKAIAASQALAIVAGNLEYFIKSMKAGN